MNTEIRDLIDKLCELEFSKFKFSVYLIKKVKSKLTDYKFKDFNKQLKKVEKKKHLAFDFLESNHWIYRIMVYKEENITQVSVCRFPKYKGSVEFYATELINQYDFEEIQKNVFSEIKLKAIEYIHECVNKGNI